MSSFLKNMLLQVEELNPKVARTVKHLSSVAANHESLIVCKPIIVHRDEFQQHWKELYEQVLINPVGVVLYVLSESVQMIIPVG